MEWSKELEVITSKTASLPSFRAFTILFIHSARGACHPFLAFLPAGLRSFVSSPAELVTMHLSALQLLKILLLLLFLLFSRVCLFEKPIPLRGLSGVTRE